MDLFWKKLRRGILRNSISVIFLLILVFCMLYLLNSNLPEVAPTINTKESETIISHQENLDGAHIGELGRMMVDMLPDDLAFTIFVPSEDAFERVLKLKASESLTEQKINDTYAIVSRVMGFSAVPKEIPSVAVLFDKEVSFDSISGFQLNIWKDHDGALVVNGIRSEYVDIRKVKIVMHRIGGVIMDAEFERSFSPDDED